MAQTGPNFYDDEAVFATYMGVRQRVVYTKRYARKASDDGAYSTH